MQLYAKAAPDYDVNAGGPAFEEQARLVSSAVRGDCVLDLCCGTGRYFEFVNCSELVGLDLSPEMLKVAKGRAAESIHLIRSTASDPPFKPGSFDAIFSIGSLGVHVPITTQLLRNLRLLLKQEGSLVFTSNTFSAHWKKAVMRVVHDMLGIKPTRWYPYQPFSESKTILNMKLKRAGFVPRTRTILLNDPTLFVQATGA